MKNTALRNKQMVIRLTKDEHQQINDAYRASYMSQSNYIRKKILTDAQPKSLEQQDIHTVRVIGITLTKILEQLKDTQLIPHELLEIKQVITEIKIIVRRLNDELNKV